MSMSMCETHSRFRDHIKGTLPYYRIFRANFTYDVIPIALFQAPIYVLQNATAVCQSPQVLRTEHVVGVRVSVAAGGAVLLTSTTA